MADVNFNPSGMAANMQERTRRQNEFEKMESSLRLGKSSTVPMAQAQSSFTGLLNRLGILSPFSKSVNNDDIVWLFDNTAYKSPHGGDWQAEFVAAVFEREDKDTLVDMVTGVVRAVGLADDAKERETVTKRVLPFLWDIRPARTIAATQKGKALKLGPTNVNGLSSNVLRVPSGSVGSLVKASTRIGGGEGSIMNMETYYAGQGGWGIVSGKLGSSCPLLASADAIRYR